MSPGNPVESFLFLLIFQVLLTLESEKRDFRIKNRSNCYCNIKKNNNKFKKRGLLHELYREVMYKFWRGSIQWIWNNSLHRLWKREVWKNRFKVLYSKKSDLFSFSRYILTQKRRCQVRTVKHFHSVCPRQKKGLRTVPAPTLPP